MKLIATPKRGSSYRYGLRKVKAGDIFETPDVYAKIWIGLGEARAADGAEIASSLRYRPPETPAPKPETIFDAPGAETDEERHRRLFPNRDYEGVVTPESEAGEDAHLIAPLPSEGTIVQTPDLEIDDEDETEIVAVEEDDAEDDIAALRARYEELYGKKPYMGWKEDQLREKIAEAEKSDF